MSPGRVGKAGRRSFGEKKRGWFRSGFGFRRFRVEGRNLLIFLFGVEDEIVHRHRGGKGRPEVALALLAVGGGTLCKVPGANQKMVCGHTG